MCVDNDFRSWPETEVPRRPRFGPYQGNSGSRTTISNRSFETQSRHDFERAMLGHHDVNHGNFGRNSAASAVVSFFAAPSAGNSPAASSTG